MNLIQMTIISTMVGKKSLRRNGVALIVNKRVWNAVLGSNLKNDRMISVGFQSKPFNITIILWTVKSGVLQSMGPQRVGHDWASELNWTEKCMLAFHYRDPWLSCLSWASIKSSMSSEFLSQITASPESQSTQLQLLYLPILFWEFFLD